MPTTVSFLAPADLHDIIRGMAVICRLYDPTDPDVQFRLDQQAGAAVGSWKDFEDNSCHFLFSPEGKAILGFEQTSPMSPHVTSADTGDFQVWPGIYDDVPEAIRNRIRDDPFADGFDYREVTFCLWNTGTTKEWQKGDINYPPVNGADPDGQMRILSRIRAFYNDFAGAFEETYNWELDPDAVVDLLSGDRVSLGVIRKLNPSANPLEARRWMPEMGFVLDSV